jgi:hypothetical protein
MADKYNPFRPDKMAPPGIFCGRMDELGAIETCLLQTKMGNPQHFLIEGEKGLGKSSLLLCEYYVATGKIETLKSRKKLDFIVVSISLQAEDDYYSIIKKILSSLKGEIAGRNALKAIGLAAWDFVSRFEAAGVRFNRENQSSDESELLSRLLQDFVKVLSNIEGVADGILLLIDEADKPPSTANLGAICKLLTEELSRNRCERLCIGLAGLPSLVDALRESHESSPRIFRIMSLKPLEENERESVLDRGIEEAVKKNEFSISISAEAKTLIAKLSEGYPHFLQEFAHCAFEEDSDNVIDRSDVAKSLYRENGAFDQLGRKYFDQFYAAPYSDDYRKVLDIMADHLDNWVDRARIISGGVKAGTVDNALRALKEKKIIIQNEMKRGQYRLPTMSFAAWIKARKLAKSDLENLVNGPTLFGATGR